MDGHTRGLRGRLSCHCLLVECPAGLVLVDTGFGLRALLRAQGDAVRVLSSHDVAEFERCSHRPAAEPLRGAAAPL